MHLQLSLTRMVSKDWLLTTMMKETVAIVTATPELLEVEQAMNMIMTRITLIVASLTMTTIWVVIANKLPQAMNSLQL